MGPKSESGRLPLWRLLGGDSSKKLEAYNTDGGWLNWTLEELVSDATRLTEEGYQGVKIKVGSSDPNLDWERIAAVRKLLDLA